MNEFETLLDQTINDSQLSGKQKDVLRASLTLFADQGYDNTTTSDIAKAAGVAEGTVYKHYKTKEQLLEALLTPFVQQVFPRAAAEFMTVLQENQSPDFADFVHFVIKDRLTFATNNLKLVKVFSQEIMHRPALIAQLKAEFMPILNGPLTQAIKRYQANGELIDWPVTEIMRYEIGILFSYVIPTLLGLQGPFAIDEAADRATQVLVKGLRP